MNLNQELKKSMKKAIIFDSGALISLAMNGLLPELRELKKIFKGDFIITQEVKKEIIDKPLTIKRFELEALKLKSLLEDKILEMPLFLGIKDSEISKKSDEILKIANNVFRSRGKDIKLIGFGESSCLALSKILTDKKIKNVIAIDERTTRIMCEKPENLINLLERKLHTKIESNKNDFNFFKEFKIIRSSELVYVAFKKNLVRLKDGDTILDALLWAVKFKGCSISSEEIDKIKKIG